MRRLMCAAAHQPGGVADTRGVSTLRCGSNETEARTRGPMPRDRARGRLPSKRKREASGRVRARSERARQRDREQGVAEGVNGADGARVHIYDAIGDARRERRVALHQLCREPVQVAHLRGRKPARDAARYGCARQRGERREREHDARGDLRAPRVCPPRTRPRRLQAREDHARPDAVLRPAPHPRRPASVLLPWDDGFFLFWFVIQSRALKHVDVLRARVPRLSWHRRCWSWRGAAMRSSRSGSTAWSSCLRLRPRPTSRSSSSR